MALAISCPVNGRVARWAKLCRLALAHGASNFILAEVRAHILFK